MVFHQSILIQNAAYNTIIPKQVYISLRYSYHFLTGCELNNQYRNSVIMCPSTEAVTAYTNWLFFFCCPWTITYGSINNRKNGSKIGNFEKFGQAYLICSFSWKIMTCVPCAPPPNPTIQKQLYWIVRTYIWDEFISNIMYTSNTIFPFRLSGKSLTSDNCRKSIRGRVLGMYLSMFWKWSIFSSWIGFWCGRRVFCYTTINWMIIGRILTKAKQNWLL